MKMWKKHPIYPLAVSRDGRIARLGRLAKVGWKKTIIYKKINIIPQSLDSNGYCKVSWNIKGKIYTKKVHILIRDTFMTIKENMQINHIDHNKQNNNIKNLELVTNTENIRKAYEFYGDKIIQNQRLAAKHRFKPVIRSDGYTFESLNSASRSMKTNAGNMFYAIKMGTEINGYKFNYKEIKI